MPIIQPTKMASNVEKVMNAVDLPKSYKSEENYEALLKQEEKKVFALLLPKIKELQEKIEALTEKDKKDVVELTKYIASLKREQEKNQRALNIAKTDRQTAQRDSDPISLLVHVQMSIAKNEDGLLGDKKRAEVASFAAIEAHTALAAIIKATLTPKAKAAIEAKAALEVNNQTPQEAKKALEAKLIFETKAALAAKVALEGNLTPKAKAALESVALEAKETLEKIEKFETEVALKEKAAAQSFIPMSMLREICSREENKAFFTSISEADFQNLKEEAESLLPRLKKQSDSRLTQDEYDKISKFEFELLKRDVKSLLADHHTEVDASMVEVTSNEYKKVTDLLEKQNKRIAEKIKEEQEKAKKELEERKNVVVNPELPPAVKLATKEEAKCQKSFNDTKAKLDIQNALLAKLPAVVLPAQLEADTKLLKHVQQRTQQSKAVQSANFKLEKIKQKKELHKTIKAAVVKQIKEQSRQSLVKKLAGITSTDPTSQKQAQRLIEQQRKFESKTAVLESAAEYCIAQLEQAPPLVQNALKKKCDTRHWKDTGIDMSIVLDSTYHIYLEEGLKGELTSVLPELRKEIKAHQKAKLPQKQPETPVAPPSKTSVPPLQPEIKDKVPVPVSQTPPRPANPHLSELTQLFKARQQLATEKALLEQRKKEVLKNAEEALKAASGKDPAQPNPDAHPHPK